MQLCCCAQAPRMGTINITSALSQGSGSPQGLLTVDTLCDRGAASTDKARSVGQNGRGYNCKASRPCSFYQVHQLGLYCVRP